MEENKFIREIHKTLKKQILNEYVDKNIIKNAIEKRRVLKILYDGDETVRSGFRTIEPYLLGSSVGTTGGGNDVVRAWQQAGDSDSANGIISNRWKKRATRFDRDNMPGWRLFRVDGIKRAVPLNNKFAQRDNFRQGYNEYDEKVYPIYAKITKSDTAAYDTYGTDDVNTPDIVVTQDPNIDLRELPPDMDAPESDEEKIKERIHQFWDVIKDRRHNPKNYFFMKDSELGDYKVASRKSIDNNYKNRYPAEDIIGNLDDLYSNHIINLARVDTSLFDNAEREVDDASDKKEKELGN